MGFDKGYLFRLWIRLWWALPIRDEVLNWLEEAKADLRHAHDCMRLERFNWACFVSQQAAEKAFKATILHVKGEYARGHDLVKLYKSLRDAYNVVLDVAKLSELSAYFTQARYPNAGLLRPSEEITAEQAKRAYETVKGVIDEISKIISDP